MWTPLPLQPRSLPQKIVATRCGCHTVGPTSGRGCNLETEPIQGYYGADTEQNRAIVSFKIHTPKDTFRNVWLLYGVERIISMAVRAVTYNTKFPRINQNQSVHMDFIA